jgi:hypothetical protein
MIPIHRDSWFTFRFGDGRIIPRFHLDGVEAGKPVSVFKIYLLIGERLGLLTMATVCEGGWVDLGEPIWLNFSDPIAAFLRNMTTYAPQPFVE